jgi:hypothetical protein
MRTTIRLLVCAVMLIVPALTLSQTIEPAGPPVKGCVLLLQNERIFEGEIEKVGDNYCIRRSGGGETWLPCDKALRLCASREDAYRYLRTQANLDDADERLRLARWCLMYDLRSQALAELRAAEELRPDHAETRNLRTNVERATQIAASPKVPPPPSPTPAPRGESANTNAVASGLELNTTCLGLFARRVQPILMNTCARCHAGDRAGEFKLAQVFGDGPLSSRSSQQNLTAVLSQIKPDQPLDSPLLRMAASAHGGAAQPPLRTRETPAYKTLEQFVQLTAAHAPKTATPAGDRSSLTPGRPDDNVFETVESKPAKDEKAAESVPAAKWKEPFAAGQQKKAAGPVDEFDPIIFNRQMHPEKK